MHLARIATTIGATLGSCVVAGVIVLMGVAQVRVAYGVQFMDRPLGGLSRTEAEQVVTTYQQVQQTRELRVLLPDTSQPKDAVTQRYPERTVTTTLADLGYQVQQESFAEIWTPEKQGNLASQLFRPWGTALLGRIVLPKASLDAGAVAEFITTKVVPEQQAPQPARIEIEGDAITIKAGAPGSEISDATLSEQILAAVDPGTRPVYVRAVVQETVSPVTTASLEPVRTHLQAIQKSKVQLQGAVKQVPTAKEFLQWFTLNQDDKGGVGLVVDEEKVRTYLKQFDTKINYEQSATKLLQQVQPLARLDAPVPETLSVVLPAKVVEAVAPGVYESGLYPGKYIYINLKEQRLYRMNGETLEKTYPVSSGKWSTPTPRGNFTVAGKSPNAFSRTFRLYMPYWMNFIGEGASLGEYGIHGLPTWPNGYKEGANHIGTPVSHGCVRLYDADVKEMFGWAETGTPVVIR
jgi:lipoprotein-anchoring transpeptidase ErfK/SrfK